MSDNRFEIRYDLLDRAPLAFSDAGNAEYPYVPTPFPPVPKSTNIPSGPDKRLRPYLLWAAIHLSVDETGRRRAVLISVTQNVGGYAEDFLQLLERQWLWAEMPTFFEVPVDGARSELWQHCLDATEDYFGRDSREYRLLNHGVAIHHGRMPGLLARLLVEVIDAGIVSIVLATSTLSEGVNLPFETVLVPNLYRRGTEEVGLREFANLVGRAGRPGVATEGRSLVLLPPEPPERDRSVEAWSARRTRNTYFGLVKGLQEERGEQNQAASPLGELLAGIRDLWTEQFGPDLASFERWLEQTAPLSKQPDDGSAAAATALDVLDGVLLPALVEMEILKGTKLSPTDAETGLRSVWNHSFARYAAETESSLEKYFVTRGRALVQDIYPESGARRRLYRTGLAPRPGTEMLATYETLLEYLRSGADYAIWPDEERFRFIEGTVDLLRAISKFAVNEKVRKNSSTTWRQILRWWLDPTNSDLRPSATQVSAWQDFVNQNFVYRFNWGLGSICSLAIDQAHQGQLQPINLEDWPETGLPWIVFWMKELLTWGTLDPVASFILARRWKYTRTDARELAGAYYAEHSDDDPNEILNAAKVRAWLIKLSRQTSARTVQAQETIPVRLLRDFSHSALKEFRVLPAPVGTSLQWLDIAGFSLAESELPTNWPQANIHAFDYVLDAGSRPHVLATPYL